MLSSSGHDPGTRADASCSDVIMQLTLGCQPSVCSVIVACGGFAAAVQLMPVLLTLSMLLENISNALHVADHGAAD